MPESTSAAARTRRSRAGCWTCKKRRKKCDGAGPPCDNCQRLGLECDTQTRLVWEDDFRRIGMSRRGPSASTVVSNIKHTKSQCILSGHLREEPHISIQKQNGSILDVVEVAVPDADAEDLPRAGRMPPPFSSDLPSMTNFPMRLTRSPTAAHWPRPLAAPEWRLLEHYVQRFSRTYPAMSSPETPFLSVMLPLAQRNSVVLDALLALSGVQLWEAGAFRMERPMLHLRQKAIQGSMSLLASIFKGGDHRDGPSIFLSSQKQIYSSFNVDFLHGHDASTMADTPVGMDDFVALLATCVMLLLYEKLSGGDQGTATPHLRFLASLFPVNTLSVLAHSGRASSPYSSNTSSHMVRHDNCSDVLRFLSALFLYNDLVRSISSQKPTLSTFYLQKTEADQICASSAITDQSARADLQTASKSSSTLSPVQSALESNEKGRWRRRLNLPTLMARCSASDMIVTADEIAAWDERLDWFPSFALSSDDDDDHIEISTNTIKLQSSEVDGQLGLSTFNLGDILGATLPTADHFFVADPVFSRLETFVDPSVLSDDNWVISEMYRVAAEIYRRRQSGSVSSVHEPNSLSPSSELGFSFNMTRDDAITIEDHMKRTMTIDEHIQGSGSSSSKGSEKSHDSFVAMGNLLTWAAQLFRLLPPHSPWQTCVLWPLGIVARDFEDLEDRQFVCRWLTTLEERLKIRLYSIVRAQLIKAWAAKDACESSGSKTRRTSRDNRDKTVHIEQDGDDAVLCG